MLSKFINVCTVHTIIADDLCHFTASLYNVVTLLVEFIEADCNRGLMVGWVWLQEQCNYFLYNKPNTTSDAPERPCGILREVLSFCGI